MSKIYIGIKFHSDARNKAKIEALSEALGSFGHQSICIQRDVEKWGEVEFTPAALMRETFFNIESCCAVVIEATEKGVGLGIEAGYAHAKRIPVFVIAEKGTEVSTTLQGLSYSVQLYENMDDLLPIFSTFSQLNGR